MAPKYQKRHYEDIADSFRRGYFVFDACEAEIGALDYLQSELAEKFMRDNPNFDAIRFQIACGVRD